MKTSGNKENAEDLPLEDYKKMAGFIYEISNIVKEEYNLIPVLHPHAGTYIEYEHEVDKFIHDINNNYLSLCLDTAHLLYSGIDPYNAILKYNSLIKHMHFKDINEKILNNVYKNKIDFDTAVSNNVFAPLGEGMVDFNRVYKNLKQIGYNGCATIEQDIDPTLGLKAIDYAKKSLNHLNQINL